MHSKSTGRRTLGLVLLTTLLWAGCGRKEEFVSKEGGFAVAVSGVPAQKKQTVTNPEGPVDIYTLTFALTHPPAEYWIIYIDYPALTVQKKGGDQILKEARDGSVNTVGGTLLSEHGIFLREYPGLEIRYEGASGDENAYKSRLYLVKNRLYVMLVTTPKGQPFSAQAEDFLNSFRLL